LEKSRTIEHHPLEPFFPDGAETLILGSFPPPAERWCMRFFYPNRMNDFWRIFGLIFFDDPSHFLIETTVRNPETGRKKTFFSFDEGKIRAFLTERKFALYDSAAEIIRLDGNASDNRLEVVRPIDLAAVWKRLPEVKKIVFTGEKSAQTLWPQIAPEEPLTAIPKPGEFVRKTVLGRSVVIGRVCSSSRAYPLSLEKKGTVYTKIFLASPAADELLNGTVRPGEGIHR